MCRECCCGPPYRERDNLQGKRFITQAEKAEKVKNYAEELGKELSARSRNTLRSSKVKGIPQLE